MSTMRSSSSSSSNFSAFGAGSGQQQHHQQRKSAKPTIDDLFLAHAFVSGVFGLFAFLLPNVAEYLLVPHGEKFYWRDNGSVGDKIEHLTIRLFGALLLAQAWIAWNARTIADGATRRMLVQAYFGFFLAALLAHLRAQLTPGNALTGWNWLNIFAFAGLGELGKKCQRAQNKSQKISFSELANFSCLFRKSTQCQYPGLLNS